MNVSIGTVDFDLDGFVTLYAVSNSETSELSRRFNKVKTLDGDVAVTDFGFTEADTTKSIEFKQDEEIERLLRHIITYHADVYVSTKDGFYLATIATFEPGEELALVELSIREKIS